MGVRVGGQGWGSGLGGSGLGGVRVRGVRVGVRVGVGGGDRSRAGSDAPCAAASRSATVPIISACCITPAASTSSIREGWAACLG